MTARVAKTPVRGVMGWMIAVVAMTMVAATARGEEAKHLLFYGNSFTMRNDVPGSVSRLAEAAGHPAPVVVQDLAGGKRMPAHLEQTRLSPEKNIEAAAVAGNRYDAVILQGHSTEATHMGNRDAFLESTLALAKLVRENESGQDAAFVLYQTWARGHGHKIYSGGFADPAAMQREVVEGYQAAREVLAEEFGEESVFLAPVGAAFASLDFDGDLYGSDNYHAGPVGSLLSAMVLYRTLYGGKIADIDEEALRAARSGEHWAAITDEQWNLVVTVADRQDIPRAALTTATAAH